MNDLLNRKSELDFIKSYINYNKKHKRAKNSTDRKTIEVLSAVNDLFGLSSKK